MEVILYGDGQAVEGTDGQAGLREVLVPRAGSGDGEVKEGFGETARLRTVALVSEAGCKGTVRGTGSCTNW